MSRIIATLACSTLLAVCVARAQEPPAPAAGGATAPAAGAPDSKVEEARLKRFRRWAKDGGYYAHSHNGQPEWCRNEAPLGSRLERLTCVSDTALTERFKTLESMGNAELIKPVGSVCPAKNGCN